MLNLYWPVYKNLEKEILEISSLVHFDDTQLSVYSVKLSEILIRCSVEIESISKDLYIANGGQIPEERDLYFDTDCLKFLEDKWFLSKKVLILSSPNFYFKDDKNKFLTPLHKAYKRGTSGSHWKQAYQAVKHERVKSLPKGNIGYVLHAMGALFILNLYFKNEVFDLGRGNSSVNLDERMGSDIFSIKTHKWFSYNAEGVYGKKDDFDTCIYLTKQKDEFSERINSYHKDIDNKFLQLLIEHPKFKSFEENIKNGIEKKNPWDILGQDDYLKLARQTFSSIKDVYGLIEYEAVVNDNRI